MIADFTIFPIGEGESLSGAVAMAFDVIESSGVRYEHHAMGTNLEGDWDEVMSVIKQCRDRLRAHATRISISIHIDDRSGGGHRMTEKVNAARSKMDALP